MGIEGIGGIITAPARLAARVAGAVLDNGDARVSDRQHDLRTTGRDGVRPGRGDGPASPDPSTVTPGPGMPGFPTPPAPPKTGDGSGTHGAQDAGIRDHLTEAAFYRVADAADAAGLDNAAAHMRHYLGNSGEPLAIDPKQMLDDLPAIRAEADQSFETQVRDVAEQRVREQYDGKPMEFQITTPWNPAYATKGASQDWFFAVGGFSYAHTAKVTVTPGPNGEAQVHVESQRHVFDRYNWDNGKAVTIGPITIEDKQLGRLHDVGLAQEFEVRGTATGPSADFTVKP